MSGHSFTEGMEPTKEDVQQSKIKAKKDNLKAAKKIIEDEFITSLIDIKAARDMDEIKTEFDRSYELKNILISLDKLLKG